VPGERKSVSVGLAVVAALSIGVSLFATGRLGDSLPVGWALLPPRVVGLVAVAIPLALTRQLRLTRRAVPLVVMTGLAEVFGFAFYVAGARHGIAVAAVLASQFAAIAKRGGVCTLSRAVTRLQLVGVALIELGVVALAAIGGGWPGSIAIRALDHVFACDAPQTV
jgi:glucose uptake protein GlcU